MCKKYSYKNVKDIIESVDGFKLLSKEYINSKVKLDVMCPKGHIFHPYLLNFKKTKSCGHPECKNIKISISNSNTFDDVKEYIEKENYLLLSDNYIKSIDKLNIQCPNGHIFNMRYSAFHQGQRCPICFNNKRKSLYSNIKLYIEKYGYQLISTEYINALTNLRFKCPKNHEFDMRYNSFQQGQRCPICNNQKTTSKPEKELLKYVKTLYKGKIIENDRRVTRNYWSKRFLELDIYLPELSKAIEYGAEYYHRTDCTKWKDMMKIKQCEKKNISLMHVDDNNWKKNKDNVKEQIRKFIC